MLRSADHSHLEDMNAKKKQGVRECFITRFPTGQTEGVGIVGNNRWSCALINIKAQRLPDVGSRLGQASLM